MKKDTRLIWYHIGRSLYLIFLQKKNRNWSSQVVSVMRKNEAVDGGTEKDRAEEFLALVG